LVDRGAEGSVTTEYLTDFEATQNGGSKAPWLTGLRRSAIERFAAQGFPGAREEDWRFNNLGPITSRNFPLAPAAAGPTSQDVDRFLYSLPGGNTLVFVNGRFSPHLSTPAPQVEGVTVSNLAAALATHGKLLGEHLGRYAKIEKSGFTALNTAFGHDGVFVHVKAGAAMSGPVHALFVSDGTIAGSAAYPRNFILLEAGATGAIIESYVSLQGGSYLVNTVTEAVVGEGARLEHSKIQRESEQAYHVGTTHIHQERDSHSISFSISLGAAICRNNLDLVLDGPGIEGQLLGLYMGRGRQEVDNHTSILHASPNCSTREVYKGILDGMAHAIFNGKVYVTPEAQKTDAKQTNRNLLLSDRAKVDTKPQLEIFADDVKCTHGATVGNLDPLAAFYLKSRGIGPLLGRKILTYAFAAEILEELPYPAVRAGLESLVNARLEEAVEA
jgi:Fe-S cluster assembly protein SufD